MTRASAAFVAVLMLVGLGGAACSSGAPLSSTGERDAATAYDGPFDLPDGKAVTVPLTGCGGPGFAAKFKVGSQTFELTIDTGSGTLAVASKGCDNCSVSPLYAPGSDAIDASSDDYLMGAWQGDVYSDTVTLEGVGQPVKMDVAAIDSQSGFFKDGGCGFGTIPFAPEGIVGFGPPDLSTPATDAFWTKLTASGAVSNVFAVELCSENGQLMIGGVDPVKGILQGPAEYTPLTNSLYYSVALTDLKLSGKSLGYGESDFGTAAVDTGSSVLVLPPDVFTLLASQIESQPAFSTIFDGHTGWLGTTKCWSAPSFSSAQIDSELPPLTLSFPRVGGGTLSLELKATDSYLPPTTSGGVVSYCSGIFAGASGETVLGSAAMLGHMVIFDLEDNQIGFAPQGFCP